MALSFRRGSAEIQDAATRKGGGDFRPFLPQIQWRQDGESKYVLVLTDIDDVATLLLHTFIPVGRGKKANGEEFTRYEDFISRRDPAIGEDHDDLEDRLERDPKTRCMGVMVELEPVMEAGKKLTAFAVKTETFTRKTDDGEIEVTAPVIGLCTQSPITLWGTLDTTYQTLGDLIEVPLQITRRGKDTNTRYDVLPFLDRPVDLAPVVEYMDGISYIGDGMAALIDRVGAEETDVARAQVVADYLLNKRINELADADRYEELVSGLSIEDMPKNAWGRKQQPKGNSRPARPPRRTAREAAHEEPEAAEPEVKAAPKKSDRFAALKSRVEARG